MAWTWDEFSLMLGRALDDEDSANPAHSDELRLDGLNAALRGLAAHRPRQAVQSYSNVSQFAWPADCYRIAAIVAVDEEGVKATLSAATVGNPGDVLGEEGAYWAWNGVIELDATYVSVTLYYHAYYPTLALGAADIAVPIWAREALVYRAAAHCLTPNLSSRARLGAFNDKQDAPPMQNSLVQAADWFLSQFERIMTEHRQAGGL
jgi:hypothetical protein